MPELLTPRKARMEIQIARLAIERNQLREALNRWASEMDEDGGYVPYYVRDAIATDSED